MVVVDHDLRTRVVIERIDREIAPHGIVALHAEDVVANDAAGLVGFGVAR